LGWDLAGEGDPEPVAGVVTSASVLKVLRPHMLQGRTYGPEDDVHGGARIAIVGESFWKRHLGADPMSSDARFGSADVPTPSSE
jgi:hypothetical protein